jgi:hypothetical protein
MRKRRIPGSRTAVWRLLARHDLTVKKTACTPPNNNGRTGSHTRWRREQFMFDPARLVFIDETAASTKMVRSRGHCPRGERLVGSCEFSGPQPDRTSPQQTRGAPAQGRRTDNSRAVARNPIDLACREQAGMPQFFRHAGYDET